MSEANISHCSVHPVQRMSQEHLHAEQAAPRTLRDTRRVHDLLKCCTTKAHHPVGIKRVVPFFTRDLPRIVALLGKWTNVFSTISEKVHILRFNGHALLSVPFKDAIYCLGAS